MTDEDVYYNDVTRNDVCFVFTISHNVHATASLCIIFLPHYSSSSFFSFRPIQEIVVIITVAATPTATVFSSNASGKLQQFCFLSVYTSFTFSFFSLRLPLGLSSLTPPHFPSFFPSLHNAGRTTLT